MSFLDSYKRLEKLCSDSYNEEHGISVYIDKMAATEDGALFVNGWDSDLKMLKHCRWARNKIAHEPDCTEENTCDGNEEAWIEGFYDRVLSSCDPLAEYRRAKTEKPKPKKQSNSNPNTKTKAKQESPAEPEPSEESKTYSPQTDRMEAYALMGFVAIIAIIALVVIVLNKI